MLFAVLFGAALLLVAGGIAWAIRSSRPAQPAPASGTQTQIEGRQGSAPRTIQIGPGRGFWFDVVGESNYQGTLRRIDGGRLAREEEVIVPCAVVPEPGNKFDRSALAVHAQGFGKVAYFDRDSANYTFAALGKMLRDQGAVGLCEGRLTGGWASDISIGVRLSILPPETFGEPGSIQAVGEPPQAFGQSDIWTVAEPPRRQRGLVCDSPGWETRTRVQLPAGRAKGLALTQEYLCQDELLRLCDARDPAQETIVFPALVVPIEGGAIVCADGGAPVGRFSKSDSERYRSILLDHLVAAEAVGLTDGWIIPEREGLGVRLSIAAPAALAAHFKATATR